MTAVASEPRVRTFPVSEIFGPTIQGEGALIGAPTLFVRFGGCDYRCSWCDSLHAVLPQYRDEWVKLDRDEIVNRLADLQPPPYMVTLSGGNPALHPLGDLVAMLQNVGYRVAVETQGTVWPDWLSTVDHLVVSPKPPSSGEVADLDLLAEHLRYEDGRCASIKVVIFDDADLSFADIVRLLLPDAMPLYLQVGNAWVTEPDAEELALKLRRRYLWLAGEVLGRGWDNVRVLPQLHSTIWGNARAK